MRFAILFATSCILFSLVSAEFCYTNNGTELEVDARQAYCFYYSSPNLSFDSSTVFINATSNNIYGHISVWVNSQLSVSGQNLADCEPHDEDDDTCSTETQNYSYTNTDGATMYVLVCLECHFWVDDCDFDSFEACLNSEAQQGVIDCPNCR